jgi:cell division septal protein FtsQ
MWFKRKSRNRRMWRRQDVLEVKVRSKVARAHRVRVASMSLALVCGTVLGLYALWRFGGWTLDQLVYENKSFAIQQIDVQTDGVISMDQLRRWSRVTPGRNLFALDLAQVKQNLEMAPMVKSVSIERVLPGTLRIRVTEREPVAQVNVLRPRDGGGIEQVIFQLDADGYVIQPLDPRQRAVPLGQGEDQLPVIAGVNASDLQAGRRVDSPQVQCALKLIVDFDHSTMSGLVDVKRIDVSALQVLVITTGQGSEVTFALDNFEKQLGRWRSVYDECLRQNRNIATLDLAVNDYTPLKLSEAGNVPGPVQKSVKPPRTRKKNV